eukprot:gene2288-4450_t
MAQALGNAHAVHLPFVHLGTGIRIQFRHQMKASTKHRPLKFLRRIQTIKGSSKLKKNLENKMKAICSPSLPLSEYVRFSHDIILLGNLKEFCEVTPMELATLRLPSLKYGEFETT